MSFANVELLRNDAWKEKAIKFCGGRRRSNPLFDQTSRVKQNRTLPRHRLFLQLSELTFQGAVLDLFQADHDELQSQMTEISSAMYLPEFGMEDLTLFEEFPMDCFDGLDFQSLVSENYSPYERPNSQRKQNPQSVIARPGPSPSKKVKVINKSGDPRLISFEHSNNTHQLCDLAPNVKLESLSENVLNLASLRSCQGAYYEGINFAKGEKQTRNPLQAQDHVMAERRRREKLNQKFITLSSIIPGLKKMDKASVLGDAIEYVKQLKEREKILEEQVAMNRKESALLTRRTILFANDGDKSPPSYEIPDKSLAEIEARVLGKDILIRIQCEKHNGCEAKILREFENLRLTVHSSSTLPFGETTLCITIIAQMDKEHSMTAKDLVGSLRKALTLDRA
ncbi:transcription factor bHLH19-like [Prosopis cineraria]|uniref:transcription factor bHLH19-like n=1 Tax=Prosopis cineraria TaxID=364024 RepID=UPI0024106A34|nr:transcription factor bHLH19-like [Prosopis cineraria]